MVKIDSHQAALQLAALLNQAGAGQDVIIMDGERAFRLSPANDAKPGAGERPGFGSWKGRIEMAPDFNEPLEYRRQNPSRILLGPIL